MSDVSIRQPTVSKLETVEASLRLDLVASSGFKMSRNKAAELIKMGDIQLNYLPGAKPATSVTPEDVVRWKGTGWLTAESIGMTSKGKHRIKYVVTKKR